MDDATLWQAIAEVERGLVDADLGGGVVKQRIAGRGGGKSSGYRTIVLFRFTQRAVFVYGFGKNERDNIRQDELIEFRRLAAVILAYGDDEISTALTTGALMEVIDEQAVS